MESEEPSQSSQKPVIRSFFLSLLTNPLRIFTVGFSNTPPIPGSPKRTLLWESSPPLFWLCYPNILGETCILWSCSFCRCSLSLISKYSPWQFYCHLKTFSVCPRLGV